MRLLLTVRAAYGRSSPRANFVHLLYTNQAYPAKSENKVPALNIVIQGELVGMWAQAHRVHFLGSLVLDIGIEQVFSKDIAFEQEGVIFLQRIQSFVERSRHGRNFCQLLRTQIVDVLIQRLA